MTTSILPFTLACMFTLAASMPASGDTPSAPSADTPAALAQKAREAFWTTLHTGDYAGIASALALGTAAAAAQPRDAEAAAHLGWLHIWRLAERDRTVKPGPELADDVSAARLGFERAVTLDPDEARYLGFYATTLLIEGEMRGDEALTAKGGRLMQEAVQRWPEFNLFTAGYPLSNAPVESPLYRRAMDDIWRNLEVCAGQTMVRGAVDLAPMLARHDVSGPKRACWNSWIAPHNVEGFFLNLGDMLVKDGDVQAARQIYASARQSADYASWPYRQVLEQRIVEADANVAAFRAPAGTPGQPRMMIESGFACMACHRQ